MLNYIEKAFNAARIKHNAGSSFYGYVWRTWYDFNPDGQLIDSIEIKCLKAFNDSRLYNPTWGYKFADFREYLQHLKNLPIYDIQYDKGEF